MTTHNPPPPPPPPTVPDDAFAQGNFTTHNTAESGSMVGFQAEVAHNVNVNVGSPSDSPEQKYAVGVRYLDEGVPSAARRLISEAIADGYDTAEVRFSWLLAMFSKRSDRDLDPTERQRLVDSAERFTDYPDSDGFAAALDAVRELLKLVFHDAEGDDAVAEKKLLTLPPDLRTLVDRHLSQVLSRTTKDKLWGETTVRAEADRLAHNRTKRVWAYFHPVPSAPRTRDAVPSRVTTTQRRRAVAGSVVFALATAYLGWLTVHSLSLVAIVAFLLAVVAGCIVLRNGTDWRYRAERIRERDAYYRTRAEAEAAVKQPPNEGFASRARSSFKYYFATYRPHGVDATAWLAETAGVRAHLRQEVADLYREQHTSIGKINWLIAHYADDVRTRSMNGTLYGYRDRYRVTDRKKLRCVLALVALLLTTGAVLQGAGESAPVTTAVTAAAALLSGVYALRARYGIFREDRRAVDDHDEFVQRKAELEVVFQEWKRKLASYRPSEREMETWLRSDTTHLIDRTLRHYRISWRDVISYAVLQVPAKGSTRAHARRGPWRYSRYALRLFLVTKAGVREVSSELDFAKATFHGEERNNFRFDAISSVTVRDRLDGNHSLHLTLTNGPVREIVVVEGSDVEPDRGIRDVDQVAIVEDDNAADLRQINLDSAGITPTLHILEAIGAEGRDWIEQGRY